MACSLLTIMKVGLDENTNLRREPKGCCLPIRKAGINSGPRDRESKDLGTRGDLELFYILHNSYTSILILHIALQVKVTSLK